MKFVCLCLLMLSCNSYAGLCTNISGTVRSSDGKTATLKATDGKTIYTVDLKRLNETEREEITRSVGKEIKLCLEKEKFRVSK